MTKRQFVVLVFRLFALYLLINLIRDLGLLFDRFPRVTTSGFFEIIEPLFTIFVTAWMISLLWRKSEWLMEKVFAIPAFSDEAILIEDRTETEASTEVESETVSNEIGIQDYYETPLSKESVTLVAFSVFGLSTALGGIVSFLHNLGFLIEPHGLSEPMIAFLISSFIQFAFGVWLFLRPWQFQGWIEKFKPKGDLDEGTDSKRSS